MWEVNKYNMSWGGAIASSYGRIKIYLLFSNTMGEGQIWWSSTYIVYVPMLLNVDSY